MENQYRTTTKEFMFEKIKQLEIELMHHEWSLNDESFSQFHEITKIEIELFQIQISLLKSKLFK